MPQAVEIEEHAAPEREGQSDLQFRVVSGEIRRVRAENSRADEGEAEIYRYEVTASSEAEVPIWNRVFEVLSHDEGAIELDWLRSGNAPLLDMHDRNRQVGIIETAEIRSKKLVVTFRMGTSERAKEMIGDIEAGIIRNISIGYRILREHLDEATNDDGQLEKAVWRVDEWEPLEVSTVSIPADRTIGFGRAEGPQKSRDRRRAERMSAYSESSHSPTRTMPQEPENPTISVTESEQQRNDAVTAERNRVAAITAAASSARSNGFGDFSEKADEFIRDGKPVEEFQRHCLENAKRTPGVSSRELGLTEEETKRYRVANVCEGIINGDLEKRAGFELEVSRAIQQRSERSGKGIAVPTDLLLRGWVPENPRYREALYGQRDLQSVTLSGADQSDTVANVVETELLPEMFVEALREQSRVLGMGVTMLPGLTGDVEIPIELANPQFYWVGEGASPTEGNYGLDKFKLEFKTTAAKIPFTRRARKQSTPSIENLLMSSLRRGLALSIEDAILNGSGGAAPTGVLNTAGVALVEAGDGSGGTAFDRTLFRTMRKELGVANVDTARARGLCHANGEFRITDTPLDAGSGRFLGEVQSDGSLRTIIGRFDTSNLCPSDKLIYGVWSMVFVGMWGGVEIDRDTATGADSGDIYLRFFQDLDAIVPRGADFSVLDFDANPA